ncbi:MAG: hypothetical protein KC421_20535 [Anaerolineales bacterium]|nr:hypothetical protein [Anaerolineales bacterium]
MGKKRPMENTEVWVGEFKKSGNLFVYDPAINSNPSTFIKLFIKEAAIMQQFQPGLIRKHIRRVDNEITILVAKSAYERWQRSQKRKSQKERELSLEKNRRTYCYCGEKLNNKSHKICDRCGWIICSQNHCGCTHKWDKE